MNGGPGCSSFDGSLLEIGPLRVAKNEHELEEVDNTAWNEYANVLFLDQPAGTGFSYVTTNDDVRELAQAAEHVVTFLSNLYQIFPEFLNMDTYIAGESYAGQYIPYIADAILKTTIINTPLKGLLIGNGWISPREQYPAYLEYVEKRNLVESGSPDHQRIIDSVDKCMKRIDKMDAKAEGSKGMVLINVCEDILSVINSATLKDGLCLNQYNTTEYRTCGSSWPVGLNHVTAYLRRPAVIEALHAEDAPQKWEQCSNTVGSHFWTPNSVPSVLLLPALLEKLPILLFAGDRDLMCAGIGIERMIEKLEWNGEVGFGGEQPQDWTVDGVLSGQWTTARGLTYVNFYNSSHMVPIDAPAAAHDMILRFMQVDTLHAAGHAAKIPSKIGKETEAVLGATQPDGSTLEMLEGLDANGLPEKDVTEDGFDKDHERLYGPRQTAMLFLLVTAAIFGIWGINHWRGGRRRARYRKLKGKGRQSIKLEETDLGVVERALPLPPAPRIIITPESPETAVMFDVGEDDEYEDEEDVFRDRNGSYDEDGSSADESGADLGKSINPWKSNEIR